MSEFYLAPRIYMGKAIEELYKQYSHQKIFVVCDGFLVDNPLIKHLLGILASNANSIEVFRDVIPDPPLETVAEAVKRIQLVQPDVLFAIGGGSALDTAKASAYFARQAGYQGLTDLVAIPSTSGSGSEVTSVAVVTDRKEGIKYPLVDESLLPTKVVLLPELVLSCPAKITAYSGMDVLCHALEALVTQNASGLSDYLAEKAIELVFKELPRCYRDGQNLVARRHMQEASCLAGLAFENAGLGVIHAVSHQIGGQFHLTHGLVNTLLMPGAVALNAKNLRAKGKYAKLARRLQLVEETNCDDTAVKALIGRIRALADDLDCPASLGACGIGSESLGLALVDIIENTEKDFTFSGNPFVPTREELVSLILGIL